jgi:Sortase domain
MSRGLAVASVAPLLALVALIALAVNATPAMPSPSAPAAPATRPAPPAAAVPRGSNPVDGPSTEPVRLLIPAIGVDSAIVTIATDGAGALQPPASPDVVGWFAAGPAPGDTGPALLAAHIDSRVGPGVFFRLRDLRHGDRVTVVRADSSSITFLVTGRQETAKSAFPTDLVYAPTPGPELRLVTCGGPFDHAARSYLDNVIVQALPADTPTWRLS